MSITDTPIQPLASVLASAEYREFKEKRLVHSQGYQHFKTHEFVHSDRYRCIIDGYRNPLPFVTAGELGSLSLDAFEQQLYVIMNYITSQRPFLTKEALAQLSHWKQRATGIQTVYATQGREEPTVRALIETCDAFFQSISCQEWLHYVIEDQAIVKMLSEKKIAKIFLKEKSARTKEKYCIEMDASPVSKVALFSPHGYYSMRWNQFKTHSLKTPLKQSNDKCVYTGTYVHEWGVKKKMVVLSSLTSTTINSRADARNKERALQAEFDHLEHLKGREIAIQPYDYFRTIGFGDKVFGFLIEEYAPLGDLHMWLTQSPPFERKKEVIDSLIQKVYQIHALDLLHLDIKEQNTVVHFNPETQKHEIRLIDWDHAVSINSPPEKKGMPKGTPLYSPPEYAYYSSALTAIPQNPVFLQRKIDCVAPSFDVWSLGVLLDQICYGSGVVKNKILRAEQQAGKTLTINEIHTIVAHISQREIDAYFIDKTEQLDFLIQGMLIVDYKQRSTMREISRDWEAIKNADQLGFEDNGIYF